MRVGFAARSKVCGIAFSPNNMMVFALFLCCTLLAIVYVQAMPSVSVVANVRGKKFDISAETVGEFSAQVESLAGIEAAAQCVLFRGKVLNASDKLEEVGVSAGDILNVVKGRKPRPANFAEASGASEAAAVNPLGENPLGVDEKEQAQAAMKSMNAFLDSDLDSYFSDADQLEKARLQMLENLDEYEKMIPGFRAQAEAIASDPVKWQEAMQKAKESMMQLKQLRDQGKLTPEMFSRGAGAPDNG